MTPVEVCQYAFSERINMEQVQDTLALAALAMASVHGEVAVSLDTTYRLSDATRTCEIDCTTAVGAELNRVVYGFFEKEFGRQAFTVERLRGGLESVRSAA
jgi:hypothetical protein